MRFTPGPGRAYGDDEWAFDQWDGGVTDCPVC